METSSKVLITGGATSVSIDTVRIITNRFSGLTSVLLANQAVKRGYSVDLLLGRTLFLDKVLPSLSEYVELDLVMYYEEFQQKLFEKIQSSKYYIIIHCAAVSDYCLQQRYDYKLPSTEKYRVLNLERSPKLADEIKRFSPESKLVSFKFESEIDLNTIQDKIKEQIIRTSSSFVVATTFIADSDYRAFIIDKQGRVLSEVDSREQMAEELFNKISSM